ncbi:MAG: alpha/beta fold hydrolase, partial [Gemmatimonadetes bacterium]|nr:alpha/beta fold hydrolase [Gemmatimonadota bacterium]
PAVPDGAMDAPALEQIWTQVSAQLGELISIAPGPVTESGVYHVVDLPATFANQSLSIRVVLTDDLLVSGLFFRPAAPPAYEAADYVDADSFTEIELTVGAEPWLLPAVLTVPTGDGPFPGIVLVHGSGPNDRDETIGGNRPFRDLAEGLSSRGIAVLRYDKRTYAHGARMTGGDVGLDEEVLDDAVAALSTLRAQPNVDASRTYLLGHSLGGMLAPEIATRDGDLAGAVVLAGPARPMGEVIVDQLNHLAQSEAPGSAGRTTLDSLIVEAQQFVDGSADDDPEATVLGAPVGYWRELETVDPVATAAADVTPYLILQGGRDYQVTEADLDLWRAGLEGREAVEFEFYQDLNHLFGAGEGMATPAEYTSEVKPVDPRVVDRIARWILVNSR